jgi:plasmid maintenance system antidote protein VapI
MFSDEALSHILTEADRIVQDAQELLDRATATGEADLIDAASNNLRQVIENRARLSHVFALRLATADAPA